MSATVQERPTMTVAEAAEAMSMSVAGMRNAMARGEIPFVRIGRRIVIPRHRLLAILEAEPRRDQEPTAA